MKRKVAINITTRDDKHCSPACRHMTDVAYCGLFREWLAYDEHAPIHRNSPPPFRCPACRKAEVKP